jgi:hypothetical protein
MGMGNLWLWRENRAQWQKKSHRRKKRVRDLWG